jgi:hypothetical protein
MCPGWYRSGVKMRCADDKVCKEGGEVGEDGGGLLRQWSMAEREPILMVINLQK